MVKEVFEIVGAVKSFARLILNYKFSILIMPHHNRGVINMQENSSEPAQLPPEGKRTTAHALYDYISQNSNVRMMPSDELENLAKRQSHVPLSSEAIRGMSATSKYRWVREENNRTPDGDGRGNYLFYQQPAARSRLNVIHEGMPTLETDQEVQKIVANTLGIGWDPVESGRLDIHELRALAEQEIDHRFRRIAKRSDSMVWIRTRRRYGDHPEKFFICETMVPEKYAYLAWASEQIHFDLAENEMALHANQRVLFFPDFEGNRFILHGSNVAEGMPTTTIASDVIYFGEKKKADMTMLGELFSDEGKGSASMHVGSRITLLRDSNTNRLKRSLDIFNAVSLGGKSVHSTDTLEGLLEDGEEAHLLGDDILLCHPDYFIQPEMGMYLSLKDLTDDFHRDLIFGRSRFLENVPYSDGKPSLASADAVWSGNMRTIIDRKDFPGTFTRSHVNTEELDEINFFVMSRNCLLPPLMRTESIHLWLTNLVLGETKSTAAEEGGKIGLDKNEALNDPFIPSGRLGKRIWAVYTLIKNLRANGVDVKLYVTNNSNVYGELNDITLEMSRILFLDAKRGGGTWRKAQDFPGMEIMVESELWTRRTLDRLSAKYVKGEISRNEFECQIEIQSLDSFMPWKLVKTKQFRRDMEDLQENRLGFLKALMLRNGVRFDKLTLDGQTPVMNLLNKSTTQKIEQRRFMKEERLRRHRTRPNPDNKEDGWNEFSNPREFDVIFNNLA